jgi:hypothetical protein
MDGCYEYEDEVSDPIKGEKLYQLNNDHLLNGDSVLWSKVIIAFKCLYISAIFLWEIVACSDNKSLRFYDI